MHLLEELHSSESWKDNGIVDGAQTEELLKFLENNENDLKDVAQQDEKERGITFSEIYRIIFGDELWNAIAEYYQINPDDAVKFGMEILEKKLGPTRKRE